GSLHSPRDLPLADNQAVEAGHHAKEMANGRRVAMLIEMPAQLIGRQAMKFADKLRQARGVQGHIARRLTYIKLDPVAGAEDDRLAAVPRIELVQGTLDGRLIAG